MCWTKRLILGCALALLLTASFAQQTGMVEDGGTQVRWTYQPLSAAPQDRGLGVLDLKVVDATTQSPVRYKPGQLAGWLQRGRGALSDSELACSDKVRALASQGIGRKAEIDLNGWRLLTFNTDRTIAFINPFVGLNNAKLESIVQLPGDVDTWVYQPQRLQLWVHASDGDKGQLLRVDTHRREITRRLPSLGGETSLAVDSDGSHVWLMSPVRQRLGVVAGARDESSLLNTSATGLQGGVSAPDGGIYTWHNTGSYLRFWQIDNAGKPQQLRQWRMPDQVVAARWSAQAQRLLVAMRGGEFAWINPQTEGETPERVVRMTPAGAQLSAMDLFDDGRRALWLDSTAGRAGAMDVGTARELASTDVTQAADTILFTDGFAYLHSTAGANATLLSLADLRAGRAQPVLITTGSASADAPAGRRLAKDPSQRGVLVANPADGVVYQYGEGMMAPIGSYSNYRRSALGVMVLDTSLTEVGPGHYRAALRNEQGGAYELVVSGVGPRMAVCSTLQLTAAADTGGNKVSTPRVTVALQDLRPSAPSAGAGMLTQQIRVRLKQENESNQSQELRGVADLILLVFDRQSGWQRRVNLKELEPGLYSGLVDIPKAGSYDWLVSSASQELPFHAGRLGRHEVLQP